MAPVNRAGPDDENFLTVGDIEVFTEFDRPAVNCAVNRFGHA